MKRYILENHPSTGLCLSGLRETEILDCSDQGHIEVIELFDCPGIKKIEFGEKSMNTARSIRIGGEWSGSIMIEGSIRSLEYVSKIHSQGIEIGCARNTADPLLRIGENGLITNSLDEIIDAQGRVDDILYITKTMPKHVEIGSKDHLPFRHLGILGPIDDGSQAELETLQIHCLDGGAQSIILQNLPHLKSVHLNGQTKMLEVIYCPKLSLIHGQGNLLRLKSSASGSPNLSVGGVWDEVEGPRRRYTISPPTREEIRTCSDISWVHVPALSYENQVKWAEIFGLDISEVMEGIPIQEMIQHLEDQGHKFIEAIEEWTVWLLTPSEQYIAMRLIAALCARGLSKESIWMARDGVLSSNKKFSNTNPGESAIQRFSRSYRTNHLPISFKNWYQINPKKIRLREEARDGLEMFSWSVKQDNSLAFNRLDLEIWIETGGIGLQNRELLPRQVLEFGFFVENMLHSTHAIIDIHHMKEARNRQEGLRDHIFRWVKDCQPYDHEWLDTIAQIITTNGVDKNPELTDDFIEALISSHIYPKSKIAIAAVLLQYIDDIRLQSLMMKHRSSPDIGRAEAKALHALSLAGRRAYTQGRLTPLEWPAVKNWRNRYDK